MERMTIQRTMILKAISSLGHASIKEIDEFLNKNSLKLPLTTIYRNINVLLNDHYIRKVVGSLDNDIYELIPLKEEHSHFICEKCGKIIDVKLSEDFKQTYDENGNFYLRKHVTYYGICKDCLKTN